MLDLLKPYANKELPTLDELKNSSQDIVFFVDTKPALENLLYALQEQTSFKWEPGSTVEHMIDIISKRESFLKDGKGIHLYSNHNLGYSNPSFYIGEYSENQLYYLTDKDITQIFNIPFEPPKQIILANIL